jgi:hypothetical protein
LADSLADPGGAEQADDGDHQQNGGHRCVQDVVVLRDDVVGQPGAGERAEADHHEGHDLLALRTAEIGLGRRRRLLLQGRPEDSGDDEADNADAAE